MDELTPGHRTNRFHMTSVVKGKKGEHGFVSAGYDKSK